MFNVSPVSQAFGDPVPAGRAAEIVRGAQRMLAEATRGDGDRIWMEPVASRTEADLDRYIERAARVDPDVWVVEIEDREGRHFLTEPVEGG